MKREDIEDIYPLSPLQEGILFQVRGTPDRHDYIVRTAWEVGGDFDPERFRQAWLRVIDRHAILRTGFSWRHSTRPVQIVAKRAELPGENLDWRGREAQERDFQYWLEADLERGFDLETAPLMRLTTIRFADNCRRLVWTRHHLLLDGWSGALLLGEVFHYYQGGGALPKPPLFRDYLGWLKKQDGQEAETWWRDRLKGFVEPTAVGPLRSGGKACGEHHEVERVITLQTSLPGLTQNTLVQGVWSLLLSRFAGVNDVLQGCTVAGRSAELAGSDRMIGLFINTLPLRVQLDPQRKAVDWLSELQREMAVMRSHEHTALAAIKTWSEIPAADRFFNSIVIFENYPVDRSLLKQGRDNGSDIRLVFRDEHTHYPLALYALPGEQLTLRMCYDVGLFECETVAGMLGHFESVLTQILERPETTLEALSLAGPEEKQYLLNAWNNTDKDRFQPANMAALLERQLQVAPDAIALECCDSRMSYAELHAAANRAALQLELLGLAPESRIGVAMARDSGLVIALLGILKAGLSYLPLDARFPESRLRYIIEDSGVSHILCDEPYPWVPAEKALCLTQTGGADAWVGSIHPKQRAYTIYTSGSTGRPKGVDVPHAAVVNLLTSLAERPGLRRGDRFLALTTLSFDISVLELFLPLSVGATLVLADEDTAADPYLLAPALEGCSHAQATPATWKMLYASGWRGHDGLTVWCGGEAVSEELAQKLARDTAGFWNMYGPTETTVWSGVLPILENQAVTIGGPIHNTDLHVLDAQFQPLPIGHVGDIFIAGDGLARGYHLQPGLTADRFVPNPYGAGGRLYRTGDLGIRRADGRIHFAGRSDFQVKIRGHRIEIGEIEKTLQQHPAIREAVVAALDDCSGEKVLVAFLIPHESGDSGDPSLRRFLQAGLPDYMIPGFFVRSGSFPLTPNGKIDRIALADTWENRAVSAEAVDGVLAPRDDREAAIQALFAKVLGVDSVSITENFFQSGGHSLQATKLLALMRKELGLDVLLRDFFNEPTVAGLAMCAKPFQKERPITYHPDQTCFPLSPAQRRFLFLHRFEDSDSAYHVATAMNIEGPLQLSLIDKAFYRLVDRHAILRTLYVDEQQHILPKPLGHVRHSELHDTSGLAIQEEISRPFDLECQAPIRLTVFRISATRHLLLLVAHHIAVDAQSLDIAVAELIALYREQSEGVPAGLAKRSLRYADFAVWQKSQTHDEAREYWLERCRGIQPTGLPIDFERPQMQTFNGGRLEFEIPENRLVIELSSQFGVTPYMWVLAVFKVQLARWCGELDMVVGSPIHGRDRPETQSMLGCFINTMVLRTDLSGGPEFLEILNRVRETVLSGIQHAALPFEELVSLAKAPRDLGRPALVQVLFNYRVGSNKKPSIHALDWQPVPLGNEGSKYELSLIVTQNEAGLHAALEYNSDLFLEATIADFRDEFLALIHSLAENPRQLPLPHVTPKENSFPAARQVERTSHNHPKEEAALVDIFSDVLGGIPITGHDSFFDHGGHSLGVVEVLSRLRRDLSVRLSLKTFFLNPTPAGLAPVVAAASKSAKSVWTGGRSEFPPLSPSQERLWYAHQLDPHSAAYNMPTVLMLTGRLDLGAMETAVRFLVQRYEILRTRFPVSKGKPYQDIQCTFPISIDHHDVADEDSALKDLVSELVAKPFDLEEEPPWRLSLIHLEGNRRVVVLNQHHILGDDWSLVLLTRRFLEAYAAYAANGLPQIVEPKRQYADYSAWSQQQLITGKLAGDAAYWQRQLADCGPMDLPNDARQLTASNDGAVVRFHLDQPTREGLERLAADQGCTLYVLLLSVWQTLLYRYGAGDDVRVATSIAGRDWDGAADMLGCFVNTLVMRARCQSAMTFRDLVAVNRETVADGLDHGRLPFEAVLKELGCEASDLFSTFFVLHTASEMGGELPQEWCEAAGVQISRIGFETGAARFDLSLSITPEADGLRGSITYRQNLFGSDRIARWVDHFKNLVRAVVADPGQKMAELPIMNELEYDQFIAQGSNPELEIPSDLPARLIAQRALLSPDTPAVCDLTQTMNYAELEQRVSGLTQALLARGVGAEEVVALAAHRSADTVVGMLAVQRAGATCLCLEVDTPAQRLAFIAADAGVRFCLGGESDRGFGAGLWTHIPLDETLDGDREPIIWANSTAYMIYTSGSTGTPKSVMVTHDNLMAYVTAISKELEPERGEQWMIVTTLAADLGLTALYPALIHGGTVHIMNRDTILDAEAVACQNAERQIDVLKCTPSWFRTLLDCDFPEMALPAKALLLGGEAFDPGLVRTLAELGDVTVYNHYGPSEATIGAVLHAVDHTAVLQVPIGRPMGNNQAFVLDQALQACPVGIPGELFLGGPQLARGYLGRPGLTSERFLPNPHLGVGERLYRTGDRVVRDSNGDLVFLGRLDHQLKLRGFRVEPGEIEAVLERWVDQAVVLALRINDALRLHAFVIGGDPDQDLNVMLTSELPDYMIPGHIQRLDQMPITANGKLDRKALERLAGREAGPEARVVYRPPVTDREKWLADVWTDLLAVERIGLDDNFFKLGGDSIMAIQAMVRIRAAGYQIAPNVFFANPTIATQLPLLKQTDTKLAMTRQRHPAGVEVPLSPIQHWFFDQHGHAEPHHFNQAVFLTATVSFDSQRLRQALQTLVSSHEPFYFAYEIGAAGPRQIHKGEAKLYFEEFDLRDLGVADLKERMEAVARDRQSSLTLAGELHRIVLFRTPASEPDRLLMIFHHLLVDGVSWRILLADLEQLYLHETELSTIEADFSDCVTALEGRLPEFREDRDLWQVFLADHRIPCDFINGPNDERSTRSHSRSLAAAQTHALVHETPRHIHVYLLTALALTFREIFSGSQFAVNLEGHGRDQSGLGLDASRTVGWLTSVYPVLLEADGSPVDCLDLTESILDGIPHNGMGFGVLNHLAMDPEIVVAAAVPGVIFNYLGRFDAVLKSSELFGAASENTGPTHSPEQTRQHLLDINASVMDGSLRVAWRYSRNCYYAHTIDALAESYLEHLESLVALETNVMTGEVHS